MIKYVYGHRAHKTSSAGNTVTGADSPQLTTWCCQSGTDDLIGGSGRYLMRGNGGDDTLSGGLGNNVLDGDDGRGALTERRWPGHLRLRRWRRRRHRFRF